MNEQSTTQTELMKKTNTCETNSTAMELILERALQSDVDLDRLKSLLELREKEIERQERQNFVRDLSTMQMEYKNIEQNALNTHTKSIYTTLDKYIDAIKKTLAKHHFALFSQIKEQDSNGITVEMTLKHILGHEISTQGTFPFDATGSKNSIQAVGSTITYARRYLLGMLLNVARKEDDTDGATILAGISSEQMNEIKELMEQIQAKESDIISFIGVKSLTQMSYKQAQTVLFALRKKKRSQMNKAQQEQQKAV
ncbi:ERF family protein [Bartonella krasnovii]|uniref:ERF family protein n=1 Tax=Bartonella krasnovii TaxID=2267275 RepID=A0ABY3VXY2_9HYPH|nr:ERF family protein [Bartonella krasnovii]UNF29475.1 ERF family protein [Bartonella krasnovii]UNF35833.1 ERF family protein [Bartonella krasnovii]